MRFNDLLREAQLDDEVELKGSFCMERCGEGVNWQVDSDPMTSATVEEAIETFKKRIIDPLRHHAAEM